MLSGPRGAEGRRGGAGGSAGGGPGPAPPARAGQRAGVERGETSATPWQPVCHFGVKKTFPQNIFFLTYWTYKTM